MSAEDNSRWAVVTGASSGLGVDFADILSARGYNLVLVARREERLYEVARNLERNHAVETHIAAMDLSEEDAAKRLYEEMQQRNYRVEVLVNNAGYGLYGYFTDIDRRNELNMLRLDILSLTELTKLFVRDMTERDSGYILQLSSVGAYQPTPTYASYSAAKSYVLNFGEALNYELRGTGVSCTVLSPGITRTEFLEVSGQTPSLYQRIAMMESRKVAEIGIQAMFKGKMSVIPGVFNKFSIWLMKLLPARIKAAVAHATMTAGQKE